MNSESILKNIQESKNQVTLSPSQYLEAIKYKKSKNKFRGLRMEDLNNEFLKVINK